MKDLAHSASQNTQRGADGAVRYRLLSNGELIQPGDQPLMDDCETWGSLAGWEIGVQYSDRAFVPVRRPIEEEQP